jgi:hypothetical protein
LNLKLCHPLEAVAQADLLHDRTTHELIGHRDCFVAIHLVQFTPGRFQSKLHRQTEFRDHPIREAHET